MPHRNTPEANIRAAFDLAQQIADQPEAYPERFVAVPADPDTEETPGGE